MPVKMPAHLYIRVDKPLRATLLAEAAAAGMSVSDLARRTLRVGLAERRYAEDEAPARMSVPNVPDQGLAA